MRIGIDAMGGDHAPVEEVKGALAARDLLGPEDRIVLVGREQAVRKELAAAPGWEAFIDLRHADGIKPETRRSCFLCFSSFFSFFFFFGLQHDGQRRAVVEPGQGRDGVALGPRADLRRRG